MSILPVMRRSESSISLNAQQPVAIDTDPITVQPEAFKIRINEDIPVSMVPITTSTSTPDLVLAVKPTEESSDSPVSCPSTEETKTVPFVGLVNKGNTCYLNSYFQTLNATPELRNVVISHQPREDQVPDEKAKLLDQLQRFFIRLELKRDGKAVNPDQLLSVTCPNFDIHRQQDIQEFSHEFFDQLQYAFKFYSTNDSSSLDSGNSSNGSSVVDVDGAVDQSCIIGGVNPPPLSTSSSQSSPEVPDLIERLYAGKQVTCIQCKSCNYVSKNESTFFDLPVPVQPFEVEPRPYSTLIEALRSSFFHHEQLYDANQYDCPRCESKQDAVRVEAFTKLPYILSLHLMRYTYSPITGNPYKISSRLAFPVDDLLDLSEFIVSTNPVPAHQASHGQSPDSQSPTDSTFLTGQAAEIRLPSSLLTEDDYDDDHTGTTEEVESACDLNEPIARSDVEEEIEADLALNSVHEEEVINVDRDVAMFTNTVSNKSSIDSGLNASTLDEDVSDSNGGGLTSPCSSAGKMSEKWLYEPFAIVVHTGSLNFGHYYSIIRSFDDNQWYVFNDEHVRLATRHDLEESFGQPSASQSAESDGASASTSSSTALPQRHSSKGAYFLMYRRVDPTRNEQIRALDSLHPYIAQLIDQINEEDRIAENSLKIDESSGQSEDPPTTNNEGGCEFGPLFEQEQQPPVAGPLALLPAPPPPPPPPTTTTTSPVVVPTAVSSQPSSPIQTRASRRRRLDSINSPPGFVPRAARSLSNCSFIVDHDANNATGTSVDVADDQSADSPMDCQPDIHQQLLSPTQQSLCWPPVTPSDRKPSSSLFPSSFTDLY